MAMLERIQGMFRKKDEVDPDLSNLSEQELARLAAERLAPPGGEGDFAESRMSTMETSAELEAGVVSLPLLGRKTAEQHRRVLGTLLLVAVVGVVLLSKKGLK